jgi:glycosyltransferase involved in cell wall biosynthesis
VRISIVVPVYNEETTISAVLDALDQLAIDKEVIVVDDGSIDATSDILRAHHTKPRLHHLEFNGGKGAALAKGIELAEGEIVVFQDADLELAPERIEALVGPIVAGVADAVYGSRFLVDGSCVPRARRGVNWFLTALANVLYGLDLTDMATGHKAFRRSFVSGVSFRSKGFEIESEITAVLARSGARFVEVESAYLPRSRLEGKKIRWWDTAPMVTTMVRNRWRSSDSLAVSSVVVVDPNVP